MTNKVQSNILPNSTYISFKNFQFAKSRDMRLLSKKLQRLRNVPEILEIVQGYAISFISYAKQPLPPRVITMLKIEPYAHFKIEGLFLLEEMLLQGDLMYKVPLKSTYFAVPPAKNSQKYVEIPGEMKSIQISVPMVLSVISSKNIHKINENTTSSLEKTLHQDHNLLKRYVFDENHPKGACNGSGYFNILITEF